MDTQNGRTKKEFGEKGFGVKIDTMIDIIKLLLTGHLIYYMDEINNNWRRCRQILRN